MTIEEEKQILERLLKRKHDAEKLPPEELNKNEKYKKEYDAICNGIKVLKEKLDLNWDEKVAMDLLLKTQKDIATQLNWKGCDEFFKDNPELDNLINVMGDKVDEAFKRKSMTAVQDAIQKYKDTCIKVNDILINQPS